MTSLDVTALARDLVGAGRPWRDIHVVAETGSTNADLLAQARAGAAGGLVLVAGSQTTGRGRMGRRWLSPPGSSLTFSVLLRAPGVPAGLLGWVPLMAGVATVTAVRREAGLDVRLKWPNDVLAGDAKLAGILAEGWGEAVVVGIGLNISQRREELPVPTATSLFLAAPEWAPVGGHRERLLRGLLGDLSRWYLAWRDQPDPGNALACGLHQEYVSRCGTLGRKVRVMLPGERTLTGTATGIDPSGRLEVRTADGGLTAVSAGDVVHVR